MGKLIGAPHYDEWPPRIDLLVVGAGGGGGYNHPAIPGGGGSAGEIVLLKNWKPPASATAVYIPPGGVGIGGTGGVFGDQRNLASPASPRGWPGNNTSSPLYTQIWNVSARPGVAGFGSRQLQHLANGIYIAEFSQYTPSGYYGGSGGWGGGHGNPSGASPTGLGATPGLGGGGKGGDYSPVSNNGEPAVANTGGGGGGGNASGNSTGLGSPGFVALRYPVQYPAASQAIPLNGYGKVEYTIRHGYRYYAFWHVSTNETVGVNSFSF